MDAPEGEEGELASEEEDPDQGDPNLSQLVLTEEEQRDFDSFNEASLMKGWKCITILMC